MRLQLVSDLHVEFQRDRGRALLSTLDPNGVDVLVVAGDLGLARDGSLEGALDLLCERYANVVFVAGNHEYYGADRLTVHRVLEQVAARRAGLRWLEDGIVTVAGQRFVGSTLWFRESDDGRNDAYALALNDFSRILGFRSWVYTVNARSAAFLEGAVRPGDVVVTHHIPDVRGTHPRFGGDPLNRFFVCQLPEATLRVPSAWLFGHTHDSLAFRVGACLFRSNPYGYAGHEVNRSFARVVLDRVTPRCDCCDSCFVTFVEPGEPSPACPGCT